MSVPIRIDQLKSIYFPSECDVDKELYYPVAQQSDSMDCMVGYFTSGSLKELAQSIVAYLNTPSSSPMRLIASPSFAEADLQAIRRGLETDENVIPLLFPDFSLNEDNLRTRSLTALVVLIAEKRIELKVALKTSGILHTKCWLFGTGKGEVAIHGSGNATEGGLAKNFEQLILSRSWLDQSSQEIVENLRDRFNKLWDNSYPGIFTAPLNSKSLRYLEAVAPNNVDLPNIQKKLIEELRLSANADEPEIPTPPQKQRLQIPDWLNYQTGEFAHQGEGIAAWRQNGFNGILAIATGGGKTLTSLTGASLLMHDVGKLFVVIAVPTKPLLDQWAEEVELFSVRPRVCNGLSASEFKNVIKTAFKKLRFGTSEVECIVVTHEALKSDVLSEISKQKRDVGTLLIADEVHNLGSKGFQSAAPDFFDFKIGLSATHERQYDEGGSNFLLDYFGGLVFEYGLDQAIGNCLVPYRYLPIVVRLTAEEEDEFADLTYQIKKLAFAINAPDGTPEAERLKILCMKRRRIVETASNKVKAFEELVSSDDSLLKRALVFCSDKNPEQLRKLNKVLNDKKVLFSQVTQAETSNRKSLKAVIEDFNNGKLDVLASMRVLDEGFNVPQTENAFLLASNTVKRQWVQRLGRVLRLSPKTGKKRALIYDFVALPLSAGGKIDQDLQALLKGEYSRVKFFTELAQNKAAEDGGLVLTSRLLEMMGTK